MDRFVSLQLCVCMRGHVLVLKFLVISMLLKNITKVSACCTTVMIKKLIVGKIIFMKPDVTCGKVSNSTRIDFQRLNCPILNLD